MIMLIGRQVFEIRPKPMQRDCAGRVIMVIGVIVIHLFVGEYYTAYWDRQLVLLIGAVIVHSIHYERAIVFVNSELRPEVLKHALC